MGPRVRAAAPHLGPPLLLALQVARGASCGAGARRVREEAHDVRLCSCSLLVNFCLQLPATRRLRCVQRVEGFRSVSPGAPELGFHLPRFTLQGIALPQLPPVQWVPSMWTARAQGTARLRPPCKTHLLRPGLRGPPDMAEACWEWIRPHSAGVKARSYQPLPVPLHLQRRWVECRV